MLTVKVLTIFIIVKVNLFLFPDTTARTDVLIVYFQTEDVAHMYQEITMVILRLT